MNKKAFALATLFLCVTIVWLGVNIYWILGRKNTLFDLVVAVLFVLAGAGMVWNERHKKRRKHLNEVNRHKLP